MCLISCFTVLIRIINLETLVPPPVDPAQAPITMIASSIDFENCGHKSKSAVA